jgi:hypothetical protein
MQSTIDLIKRTLPFIYMRIAVYVGFAVVALLFLGVMLAIGAAMGAGATGFLVIIVSFVVVWVGLKAVEKYVLYLVKAGHVAVLTQLLLNNNTIPEGKSQIEYGKEQVVNSFGTTSIFFAIDRLVHGAVKQIQTWMMRAGELLQSIPAAKFIIGFISRVLGVVINYVDEAVLSYILVRRPYGESPWKSAADGVLLYALSWKNLLKSAVGIVIFILVLWWGVFFLTLFPLMGLASILTDNTEGFNALSALAAIIVASVVKRALADPIATVAMIKAYYEAIQNQQPSTEWHGHLLNVSSKYRELVQESGADAQPGVHPGQGTSV